MIRNFVYAILMIVFVSSISEVSGKAESVRILLRQRQGDEKVITYENLIKIRQFILKQGKRETYCTLFSDGPAYHTKSHRFYLDPDLKPGLKKPEYYGLTIRQWPSKGGIQWARLGFQNKDEIFVQVPDPADELSIKEVRGFVENALKQILTDLKSKEPNRKDAVDGE